MISTMINSHAIFARGPFPKVDADSSKPPYLAKNVKKYLKIMLFAWANVSFGDPDKAVIRDRFSALILNSTGLSHFNYVIASNTHANSALRPI